MSSQKQQAAARLNCSGEGATAAGCYEQDGREVDNEPGALTQEVRSPANVNPFPASGLIAALLLPAIAAVYLAVRGLAGFGLLECGMLIAAYALTGFGITGGYHRLATHRSYVLPQKVRWFVLMLGSMAIQGSLFNWVATHRRHHRYSDRDGDPHSPVHGQAGGIGGVVRGFIHAQMGWYLEPESSAWKGEYIPDLVSDPDLKQIERLFPVFAVLSLTIPAAAGALVRRTALGAVDGLFWGGIIRTVLVHHATGSVNSVCHLFGTQPYRSTDNSRNNVAVALVMLGEGWHNNHHAFPTSAFHGLRWWQIDVTGRIISVLEMMKIASNVKRAAIPSGFMSRRKV